MGSTDDENRADGFPAADAPVPPTDRRPAADPADHGVPALLPTPSDPAQVHPRPAADPAGSGVPALLPTQLDLTEARPGPSADPAGNGVPAHPAVGAPPYPGPPAPPGPAAPGPAAPGPAAPGPAAPGPAAPGPAAPGPAGAEPPPGAPPWRVDPGPGWYAGPPPAGLPTDAPAPEPPAAPRRTHRWGLGAYLLVELIFLLASAAVGALVIGDGPPQAGTLAIALAVPTLIAAGTAVLITKLRGNGPRADLHLRFSWSEARLGAAFGVGGLFVTLPASVLYMSIVGPDATSAVGEVFGDIRASWPLALVIFLTVVFIAPLCEEILYRGLLWGAVERLGAGRWVALVVTTLLFALAHFEFTRTPLLLVVAVPIALARLHTDGLLASIVAHQVNNLLPGIALLLGLVGAIPMT